MREKVCCFTGHRQLQKEKLPEITRQLEGVLTELIESGVVHFGCGGAVGFDQLAGETVLKLKARFPHISLIMVLPCAEQDNMWRQQDKDRYHALLKACDKKVCLQMEYDEECMLRRNRHLIDNSGVCVAYLTKQRGGTMYTVKYARKQNVPIINIADCVD